MPVPDSRMLSSAAPRYHICQVPDIKTMFCIMYMQMVGTVQVPTGALPRSLVENAAITLGRSAWMCPEPLAPHVSAFLGPW
jgi:hypothetical protein